MSYFNTLCKSLFEDIINETVNAFSEELCQNVPNGETLTNRFADNWRSRLSEVGVLPNYVPPLGGEFRSSFLDEIEKQAAIARTTEEKAQQSQHPILHLYANQPEEPLPQPPSHRPPISSVTPESISSSPQSAPAQQPAEPSTEKLYEVGGLKLTAEQVKLLLSKKREQDKNLSPSPQAAITPPLEEKPIVSRTVKDEGSSLPHLSPPSQPNLPIQSLQPSPPPPPQVPVQRQPSPPLDDEEKPDLKDELSDSDSDVDISDLIRPHIETDNVMFSTYSSHRRQQNKYSFSLNNCIIHADDKHYFIPSAIGVFVQP
ncbi:hypothetical protein BLNAU_2881 [Blattamonas nauphoetae]|uniref:Uncharacterized protein n=1 Tax=Blattamonas nauphoetae TaxID=2049346 RepID=A0ABQ9YEL5_9EUKA|nr:hypothetical protein BLNAU_2881 [Blattamonas nauphoetae]